jgi:hypothetical protein
MAAYNKNMPGELLKHMADGYSFTGSCGKLGISRSTGYNWVEKHKKFAEAKELGFAQGLAMLETCALMAVTGQAPKQSEGKRTRKLNVTMAIFILKTRYHEIYGEKLKIDSQQSDGNIQLEMKYPDPRRKKDASN